MTIADVLEPAKRLSLKAMAEEEFKTTAAKGDALVYAAAYAASAHCEDTIMDFIRPSQDLTPHLARRLKTFRGPYWDIGSMALKVVVFLMIALITATIVESFASLTDRTAFWQLVTRDWWMTPVWAACWALTWRGLRTSSPYEDISEYRSQCWGIGEKGIYCGQVSGRGVVDMVTTPYSSIRFIQDKYSDAGVRCLTIYDPKGEKLAGFTNPETGYQTAMAAARSFMKAFDHWSDRNL